MLNILAVEGLPQSAMQGKECRNSQAALTLFLAGSLAVYVDLSTTAVYWSALTY